MAPWLEIHFILTLNSEFCDTKSLIRCSENFSKKKQISENLDKIFEGVKEFFLVLLITVPDVHSLQVLIINKLLQSNYQNKILALN